MKLDDLRGWMQGEDALVVGCGKSGNPAIDGAHSWRQYGAMWTIGCNRAVAYCRPDFAVCVEPRRERECWQAIASANPMFVFSHIKPDHPRAVRLFEGCNGGKDVLPWLLRETDSIPPSDGYQPLRLPQSPFYAAAVACVLGFETIGLIGVDLDDEKRWPVGGREIEKANAAWCRLRLEIRAQGSQLVNLNRESRLTTMSVPHGDWSDIRQKGERREVQA